MPQHNIDIKHDPTEKELDVPLTLAEQITKLKQRVTHLETLEGGGDWVALDKTELSADTASITFASIIDSFIALKIVSYVRTDVAAVGDGIAMNFNNDAGANYYWLISTFSHSATLVTFEGLASTTLQIGGVAGDTAPANVFSPLEITIPNYANAVNHKAIIAQASSRRANTTGNIISTLTGGHWADIAAITEIDMTPSTGTNFKSGSNFYLFGLRGST